MPIRERRHVEQPRNNGANNVNHGANNNNVGVNGAGNVGGVGNVGGGGVANVGGGVHSDVIDRTPGSAVAPKTANITGPFAGLAKKGDFSGYVMTKSGQELFVSVRISHKNPGGEKPLVYLDGLAARRNRADMMADKFRDEGDRTVISILLPGQGETLVRDLQKHKGASIDHDIKDSDQANAVIEVLNALGVDKPVDIFGLSYGGAIAAATIRDHGDRIDHALLVAPHTRSQARDEMGEMVWQMTANNPWNPMGTSMYRSAAKSTLSKAFGDRPEFKDFPGAFGEALFRLSMGIDRSELDKTTRGANSVDILVAEGDGASPAKYNAQAVKAAKHGSLTMAPDVMKGQHDLVSANPEFVVSWVTQKLNPERSADVDKVLTEAMKKRLTLQSAQQALGTAAQVLVNAGKGDPKELLPNLMKGAALAAAAGELAVAAVPGSGKDAVDVANNAKGLAAEALKMMEMLLKDAPADQKKPLIDQMKKLADDAAKHATAAQKALDG